MTEWGQSPIKSVLRKYERMNRSEDFYRHVHGRFYSDTEIITIFESRRYPVREDGHPIYYAIPEPIRYNVLEEDSIPDSSAISRQLTLNQFRFSIHIEFDRLYDIMSHWARQINLTAHEINCSILTTFLSECCRFAHDNIENESFDGRHNTILQKVRYLRQTDSNLDIMLLDVTLYSTDNRTAETYLEVFRNVIYRAAHLSFSQGMRLSASSL